ncbi:MAG TPA: hypothetical protein VF173_35610 [Thermoanaerobaculia bacterium]|nr:hypothetical protein [Thermoanaerobaculia bacterium]
MTSYPDLTACNISSMEFSFHVSAGLEQIDAFWEDRGLDRSRERLLFAGYTRQGNPHTAYLQWARSHEGCSDVYLGLDARAPSTVWPGRPSKSYKLREHDFRAFVAMVRKLNVHLGIRARYAYSSDALGKALGSIPHLAPSIRITSVTFEVLDGAGNPAANVAHERRNDQWLVIVEPIARFPFPESEEFFSTPYETGCILARVVRQEKLA